MIINHDILSFDISKSYFTIAVDEVLLTKYLKGTYRENKPRFLQRFVDFYKKQFTAYEVEENSYLIDNIIFLWDHVKPFSYKEAFEIENPSFRATVFSSINIREMIDSLGATRVKVEGKELINKTWNPYKEKFEETPYSVVYELYHVNGEKLGIREGNILPVIKCWCTTTNQEHWLWVDEASFQKDSPLDAIASTCVIYKSMHGKIKHIIRQGDVFLFEMLEDVVPSENEELTRLSMDEYFGLLKSQA